MQYLGPIVATLINLILLINPMLLISPRAYTIIDFNTYLLLESIIFNNRVVLYLVNNKELLVPGSFIKSKKLKCVEAGT